jgi:N-methylhydantoinase B
MSMGVQYQTGKKFIVSNNEGIGWGGTYRHDGANALQHPSTSSIRNTSIEVLEHTCNVFHERLELITDSAGPGKHRGGLGVRRDVSFSADSEIISQGKKSKTLAWGLKGGGEPSRNEMVVWPGTEKEKRVGMFRTFMKKGESFANFSAGGGGWGHPYERTIEKILSDVKNEYISKDSARDDYGVIVADDGSWSETAERLSHHGK